MINAVGDQLADVFDLQHPGARMHLMHLRIKTRADDHRIRPIETAFDERLRGVDNILKGIARFRPVAPRDHLPAFDDHQAFIAHLRIAVENQIVFGIGAERRRACCCRHVQRRAGLSRRFDVAPVQDEIFVDDRDDAALTPHRAHGIGFLFAEQADAPHRRAGEVIVNDGLNPRAERPPEQI